MAQPVEIYLDILEVMRTKGELGVNDLFRETGSNNRPAMIKAIKKLRTAGITTNKKSRQHSQQKIQQLTDVGRNIIELMEDTRNCKISLEKLKASLIEQFDLSPYEDSNILKNKLGARKWNGEIDWYPDLFMQAEAFQSHYVVLMVFTTIYRANLITLNFKNNNIVRDIVNKLALDAVAETLNAMLYIAQHNDGLEVIRNRYTRLAKPILQMLEGEESELSNSPSREEVKIALKSLEKLSNQLQASIQV